MANTTVITPHEISRSVRVSDSDCSMASSLRERHRSESGREIVPLKCQHEFSTIIPLSKWCGTQALMRAGDRRKPYAPEVIQRARGLNSDFPKIVISSIAGPYDAKCCGL